MGDGGLRVVRGVSGTLAGGVVGLMLLVVGTAVFGRFRNFPGPGVATVGWHVLAAAVAVWVQWQADRRRDVLTGLGAAAAVVTVTAALLWTQWWR